MRLTYIILAYKLPDVLIRLVDRLDVGSPSFIVHVDRKTDDATYQAMTDGLAGRSNVHFLEERVECHWGEFGRVAASIAGLRHFVAHGGADDRVVLLSGQDYPLKPAARIEAFFRERPGISFLEHFAMPDFGWQVDGGMYFLERGRAATGLSAIEVMHNMYDLIDADRHDPTERRRLPRGLKPFHGSSWWAFTYDRAEYVVRFVDEHPEVVRFFDNVVVPDEMFFQTILLNAPLSDDIKSDALHFVDWSPPRTPHPKLLDVGDFHRLVSTNYLFARKFDPGHDAAILDLLDDHLGLVPAAGQRVGLTIGVTTDNDFDGLYFTLQALRLYQDLDGIELLVVDTYGCEHTKNFVEASTPARYVRAGDADGSAAAKNRVFAEAAGAAVLCCDSHVYVAPGAIARLLASHRAHPDSADLLHGPLLADDLTGLSTHLDPAWRDQAWGTPGTDPRGLNPAGEPFEITMQRLGVFSCRKEAWPGFPRSFGAPAARRATSTRRSAARAGAACACPGCGGRTAPVGERRAPLPILSRTRSGTTSSATPSWSSTSRLCWSTSPPTCRESRPPPSRRRPCGGARRREPTPARRRSPTGSN